MINFFRYSVFKVLKRLIFSPRRSTLEAPLRGSSGHFQTTLLWQAAPAVTSAIRDREQFHAPDLSSLMRLFCINKSGSRLLFHTVSSIVPSAVQVLTVVFGMRTGVTPARIATRQTYDSRVSAQDEHRSYVESLLS